MKQNTDKKYYFSRKGVASFKENPWLKELAHTIKKGRKMTGYASSRQALVDTQTGEVSGDMAVVGVQKVVDKEEFVKFFGAGIEEVFDLTKTGKDLFRCILGAYLDTKNAPDQIYINFAAIKEDFGYPKGKTSFMNGMGELLQKGFFAPVEGRENLYWVNPHLFYKGDRMRIVKEYVRAGTPAHEQLQKEQEGLQQHNLLEPDQ